MADGRWRMEEEKGRPETGGLKAEGSETADGEAAAATNPLRFDRQGDLSRPPRRTSVSVDR